MASRSFLWIVALLTVSPVNRLNAGTPEQPPEESDAENSGTEIPSGIRADRLSERQLNTWRSIQSTVFARDASGRFKHPNLQALWQQAEDSGHVIYIEFCKQPFRWASAAGDFHIEKPYPNRQKRAAVIRLYLSVIDHVQVNCRVEGTLGFIPFLGLRKTERYAEVLGHELSHAVWILADPDLTKLCERPVNADVKTTDCHRQGCDCHPSHIEMRERLIKLESLMGELEMRARATESVIWRELRAGNGKVSPF
jgi:hypothetical protein